MEVDRDLVGVLTGRPDLRAAVVGFDRVAVDPRWFRSRSMNERLAAGE